MPLPFFTISLDFELFWGMRDVTTIEKYGKNILQGRKAIPEILKIFKERDIHATWGVVGMITFSEKKDLLDSLPDIFPEYLDKNLNPYQDLNKIGKNEKEDPYHYGYSLVNQIIDTKGMELASHSFSHFYCKEKNFSEESFDSDLKASISSLNNLGVKPKSYIFCRNQFEDFHLNVLSNNGFKTFRGNEKGRIFDSKANKLFRGIRLLDTYLNLSGDNFSELSSKSNLVNVPSSRFFRPVQTNFLEKLKVRRIIKSMSQAAKNNQGFHLWWHPHNFGNNLNLSIISLIEILDHFRILNEKYGMESLTMYEASNLLSND
tara:strand:- start:7941 stop:8894 length:954 start_codon:yes stop_codon:yes gene_type:complete